MTSEDLPVVRNAGIKITFFFLVVFGALISARGVRANDIYFAQSALGAANGADCADAYAYNDGTHGINVASNWVAGNTLHVCGTIVGTAGAPLITAQASGSAGNPIMVKLETGAVLHAPYFPGNPNTGACSSNCGGIQAINKQYIIFDGGTNGVVQNTLNGSSTMTCLDGTCSYQQSSVGVFASGKNNIIRNFNINNIYISCGSTNCSDTSGGNTAAIRVDSGSTNTYVCNNSTAHAYYGVTTDTADSGGPSLTPSCPSNAAPSGFHIFQNTLSDHCHHISPTGHGAINIWMNDVSNWADWIWPGTGNGCHTDGIITFSDGTAIMTPYIYDNYLHGDLGLGSPTAFIFCTYNGSNGGSSCAVFNNLLVGTGSMAAGHDADIYIHSNAIGPHMFYNNTFVNAAFSVTMDGDSTQHYTFENNVFVGGGSATNTYAWTAQSANEPWSAFTFTNYNDFYSLRTSAWSWNGTVYSSLVAWTTACKSGTGGGLGTCDDASTTGNPRVDGSYHLQSGSAAIGLGANLSSLGIAPLNSGAPSSYGVGSTFDGVARPSSGAWDAGAFPNGSLSVSAPAPPQDLVATVQ